MAYSTLLCAVSRKTLRCLTCIPHTNNVVEASPTVEKYKLGKMSVLFHLWHVACLPYLGARLKLHGCSLLFDGLIGLGTPVCAV